MKVSQTFLALDNFNVCKHYWWDILRTPVRMSCLLEFLYIYLMIRLMLCFCEEEDHRVQVHFSLHPTKGGHTVNITFHFFWPSHLTENVFVRFPLSPLSYYPSTLLVQYCSLCGAVPHLWSGFFIPSPRGEGTIYINYLEFFWTGYLPHPNNLLTYSIILISIWTCGYLFYFGF